MLRQSCSFPVTSLPALGGVCGREGAGAEVPPAACGCEGRDPDTERSCGRSSTGGCSPCSGPGPSSPRTSRGALSPSLGRLFPHIQVVIKLRIQLAPAVHLALPTCSLLTSSPPLEGCCHRLNEEAEVQRGFRPIAVELEFENQPLGAETRLRNGRRAGVKRSEGRGQVRPGQVRSTGPEGGLTRMERKAARLQWDSGSIKMSENEQLWEEP
nr:unnamed protein product [Homo sapiens]